MPLVLHSSVTIVSTFAVASPTQAGALMGEQRLRQFPSWKLLPPSAPPSIYLQLHLLGRAQTAHQTLPLANLQEAPVHFVSLCDRANLHVFCSSVVVRLSWQTLSPCSWEHAFAQAVAFA